MATVAWRGVAWWRRGRAWRGVAWGGGSDGDEHGGAAEKSRSWQGGIAETGTRTTDESILARRRGLPALMALGNFLEMPKF